MSDTTQDEKRLYPYISANVWTELRVRFKQKVPSAVTAGYLQTALGFASEKGAKNLLPQLRLVGLIDTAGVPTELAKRYRMDDDYPAAAQEIVEAIYPSEVRELFPGPHEDVAAVAGWFMRHTGGGQASAVMQARFYASLISGEIPSSEKATKSTKAPAAGQKPPAKRVPKVEKPAKPTALAQDQSETPDAPSVGLPSVGVVGALPGLHIDVQIHIDAEATTEQIDAVFASMAKHLYGRE
jgi:hypothetical protein